MAPRPSQSEPAFGHLLAFPRADLRHLLSAALKHHRLPENLAQALVRDAAHNPSCSADAALASALARRLIPAPLDFQKDRAILLVGPSGSGKSAIAAKIAHCASRLGLKTQQRRADEALALFRARSGPSDVLTVMEADGFNPLNPRAASAFSALGEVEGLQTLGVVSALNDAEDIADIVVRFRFRRVIVTGLDRTRRLGAVLAASLSGARLAHVSYGPKPQDPLDVPDPHILAAQLLGTAH